MRDSSIQVELREKAQTFRGKAHLFSLGQGHLALRRIQFFLQWFGSIPTFPEVD